MTMHWIEDAHFVAKSGLNRIDPDWLKAMGEKLRAGLITENILRDAGVPEHAIASVKAAADAVN